MSMKVSYKKIKDVGDYFESSLNSPIIKIICFINQDEREKNESS